MSLVSVRHLRRLGLRDAVVAPGSTAFRRRAHASSIGPDLTGSDTEPEPTDWSKIPVPLRTGKEAWATSHEALDVSSTKVPEERRRFPRRDSGCIVAVCRKPKDDDNFRTEWSLRTKRSRGSLIDLSMTSIAFLLPESFEIGESLVLRLIHPTRDAHLDCTGEVFRCTAAGNGCYKVVCQVTPKLTLDDMRTFGFALDGGDAC